MVYHAHRLIMVQIEVWGVRYGMWYVVCRDAMLCVFGIISSTTQTHPMKYVFLISWGRPIWKSARATILGMGYGCEVYWVWGALVTGYCSLFTVHYLLFTIYCSLLTVHCSLFTVHCLLLTIPKYRIPRSRSRIIMQILINNHRSYLLINRTKQAQIYCAY